MIESDDNLPAGIGGDEIILAFLVTTTLSYPLVALAGAAFGDWYGAYFTTYSGDTWAKIVAYYQETPLWWHGIVAASNITVFGGVIWYLKTPTQLRESRIDGT
ncbi:hypothetical protein [Haloarcula sp. Atlit-120R]|uniref:hypothetical protein n=1 Tax=Haloarcula sp. Atlit-120R TaxID=2282135 RepID=UPI000EF1D97B|nr:hypothetical protein [Haloarcula sp. Atlit-120R]RLM32621.1 hypothetical protein DVK01_20320 [Haloarcula sp. Atlit-120R]